MSNLFQELKRRKVVRVAQASINAMGKQINSSTTIKLVVQAGNSRAGTTLSATWISTQATTA